MLSDRRIERGSPIGQESKGSGERATLGRQSVFEPWGPFHVGSRDQQAINLEAPESLREDVRGDPGDRGLQVAVAHRSAE